MILVGIDFSINHPGVCISHDLQTFEWLGVNNTKTTKKKEQLLIDLQSEYAGVTLTPLGEKDVHGSTYSETERKKVINMVQLVYYLVHWIEERAQVKIKPSTNWLDSSAIPIPEEQIHIAFEGFSYGSQGNSLVDIAQATGIMKNALLTSEALRYYGFDWENLHIFSPSELKNVIGCKGNADKLAVFNQFCQDPGSDVRNSSFYKLIIDNTSDILLKGKVEAPFMDMIDSYLAVLKLHRILSLK